MKLKAIALGAVMALGAAAGAQAATVNFAGSNADLGSSYDFGDFTVSATATGIANSCGATVTQSSAGLGVNGCPDTQKYDIDGFPLGSAEKLTFTFDSMVTLTGITLGGIGDYDEYDYYIDGSYAGTASNASWSGSLSLDSFGIAAVGDLLEGDGFFFLIGPYDAFTVKSISYEVQAVPLPAGGLLLLGGLGSLAALRRRKKAA